MSLERIIKDAAPVAAANALLVTGMQEIAPHINEGYQQSGVLPYLATSLVGLAYFVGARIYWRNIAKPPVVHEWTTNARKKDRIKKISPHIAPIGIALPFAYALTPHITGFTEEIVHNGLALGTLYAANKFLILPGAKKMRDIWRTGKAKLIKYAVLGGLTAGMTVLGDSVQNTAKDFYNSGRGIVDTLSAKKLDDYFIQDRLRSPVNDKQAIIVSSFGYRADKTKGYALDYHEGIELEVKKTTAVLAADDGTVKDITGTAGNYTITLHHNRIFGDVMTKYVHVSNPSVNLGQSVQRGQPIAYSAGAGDREYIDFQVEKNGKPSNPL